MAVSVRKAFRLHLPVRRPSPAMIVALIALLLSVTGNAAAAVIISSNGQVATGTISGHQPPAGDHPNIIAGSISAADLAAGYRTSLLEKCSGRLQHDFGLCFDATPNAAAPWLDALQTCASRNLRLPSLGELALIYQASGAQQDDQWTDGFFEDGSNNWANTLGQSTSRHLGLLEVTISSPETYRCVANAAQ